MKVIDSHMHYWKEVGWWPQGFQRDIAEIMAKSTWPEKDPDELLKAGAVGKDMLPLDPDGSALLEDQKYVGTDLSVILPVDWGMTYKEDAPVPIEEINKANCDLAKKYPGRVYSYCGVDPRRPSAVKIFEKAVTEWGAKGLKLYPPCGFYPNDPICFPLYQKAVDLGVPVLIHTGYTFSPNLRSRTAHPQYIEDVSMAFPDLKIIMAHSGVQTLSGDAWWEAAIGTARGRWNVYLDIAAWNETAIGLTRNIPELLRKLRIECNTVGAHHVLFGTDLPGYQLPEDREESRKYVSIIRNLVDIGKEHGYTFSQEEAELIAHGNAERIIGI